MSYDLKPYNIEDLARAEVEYARVEQEIRDLSYGARRHSEKTPSFREGMKAKPRS